MSEQTNFLSSVKSAFRRNGEPEKEIQFETTGHEPQEQGAAAAEADAQVPYSTEPESAGDVIPLQPPEITKIARGTTVIGEIRSDGDVEVAGSLHGNLEAQGNVRVSGEVIGDTRGRNIDLMGASHEGNLSASGAVKLDSASTLYGDVAAENLFLEGRVKGNLAVQNRAAIGPEAVLLGNLSAKLISVSEGAKLRGDVRIENGETDFEDLAKK